MQFTMHADVLRAVTPFMAKKDVRKYLTGLHIRADGTVEATDGTVAAVYRKAASGNADQLIVKSDFKVPARAALAHFDVVTGLVTYSNQVEETVGVSTFTVLDARYPELDRVMRYKEEQISAVGIDVELLAKIAKAVGHVKHKGCLFRFSTITGGVLVTHPAMPDWEAIIMPCRV